MNEAKLPTSPTRATMSKTIPSKMNVTRLVLSKYNPISSSGIPWITSSDVFPEGGNVLRARLRSIYANMMTLSLKATVWIENFPKISNPKVFSYFLSGTWT